MVEPAQHVTQGALVGRILGSYGDVRASWRREWAAGPDEARLLFFVFLGCALLFLARLPDLIMVNSETGQTGPAMIAGNLVGAIFFAPLLLYGLAALSRLVSRIFGGRGSWQSTRLALFWAILLGVPFVLLSGAFGSVLRLGGMAGVAEAIGTVVSLLVLWFWALCLAEAEGFRSSVLVLAGLLVVPCAAIALMFLARPDA